MCFMRVGDLFYMPLVDKDHSPESTHYACNAKMREAMRASTPVACCHCTKHWCNCDSHVVMIKESPQALRACLGNENGCDSPICPRRRNVSGTESVKVPWWWKYTERDQDQMESLLAEQRRRTIEEVEENMRNIFPNLPVDVVNITLVGVLSRLHSMK